MSNAIAIAYIVVMFAVIGLVAASLDIVDIPLAIPDSPDVSEPSGGLLDGILRALIYAFQAVGAIIALMFTPFIIVGSSAIDMPQPLQIILPLAVGFFLFYIVIRLIRGGG